MPRGPHRMLAVVGFRPKSLNLSAQLSLKGLQVGDINITSS